MNLKRMITMIRRMIMMMMMSRRMIMMMISRRMIRRENGRISFYSHLNSIHPLLVLIRAFLNLLKVN